MAGDALLRGQRLGLCHVLVHDGPPGGTVGPGLGGVHDSFSTGPYRCSRHGTSFLRQEAEDAAFHHEFPVARGLKTDWEGAIWVQRHGDASQDCRSQR